jgi:phosphoribosylanthranilate isomerase
MRTRIKFCGMTRVEDAREAARLGADAIGLVFYAPSTRAVEIEQAQRIAASLPPLVSAVGLFVNADADWIEDVIRNVPLDLLQFHGDESPADCARYGKPFIKAIRMRPDIDLAAECARYAAARGVLLDSYQADRHGGTGDVFDWQRIPANLPLPVILAGGLTPENVGVAIRSVHPFAVDVSSGVERERGIKDAQRMAAFVAAVQTAQL